MESEPDDGFDGFHRGAPPRKDARKVKTRKVVAPRKDDDSDPEDNAAPEDDDAPQHVKKAPKKAGPKQTNCGRSYLLAIGLRLLAVLGSAVFLLGCRLPAAGAAATVGCRQRSRSGL